MVDPSLSFRLVYNGANLIEFFKSVGYTQSINTIEEFDVCADMFARMGVLGLPNDRAGLEAWLTAKGSDNPSQDLDQRLAELGYTL